MYRSGITWNEDGTISTIWEEDGDGYGHNEGGFTRRDSPNFEKDLEAYLRSESYYSIVELTKKTDKDPVLRKVLGKLLLDLMIGSSSIIKEAKVHRKKEEEEAKKKAEEMAKKPVRYRLTLPGGKYQLVDITYRPDGSIENIETIKIGNSREEDTSR